MIAKRIVLVIFAMVAAVVAAGGHAPASAADDIRTVYRRVSEQLEAGRDQRARETVRIELNKEQLEQRRRELESKTAELQRRITRRQAELAEKRRVWEALNEQRAGDEERMTNLSATVRVSAKQLQDLLQRSPLTALDRQRPEELSAILDGDYFPGLDDMGIMAELFFAEMEQSAQVRMPELEFIGSDGRSVHGPVLLVGPFLAAHEQGAGPGLLRYNAAGRHLAAIGAALPGSLERAVAAYLNGTADAVPLDLSDGAAFEQLVQSKSYVERVMSGGVLVWPILALAVIAIAIGVERALFLKRVHDNTDRTMGEVNRKASEGDWEACRQLIQGRKRSPVYNVVRAGLLMRHEEREVLESVLQEAILKELPRLERALPLLNIMAAVAPLLGLLGTVTGMIGTFEIINIYGTGDPRLMSGGISVALVTTMLGLIVAIPIMLLHTFLSRQVEHIIGDMEEKAVALTNIIHLHGRSNGATLNELAA